MSALESNRKNDQTLSSVSSVSSSSSSSSSLRCAYSRAIASALHRAHGRGVSREQLRRFIARHVHGGAEQRVHPTLFEQVLHDGIASARVVPTHHRLPSTKLPTDVHIEERVGMHAERGDREYQEDRVATARDSKRALFAVGVFDGHCGSGVSEKLCDANGGLLPTLLNADDPLARRALPPRGSRRAAHALFERYDRWLKQRMETDADGDYPGSTASVLVRRGGALALYNVGDSRTVLFDRSGRPLLSTVDHNPETPRECRRVHERGGTVEYDDDDGIGCFRVDGFLNMARAFGDFGLKGNGQVTPHPDVFVAPLSLDTDTYAVLASDGVWDAFSNAKLGQLLARSLDAHGDDDLDAAAADLVHEAVAETRLQHEHEADNATALVVRFRPRPIAV